MKIYILLLVLVNTDYATVHKSFLYWDKAKCELNVKVLMHKSPTIPHISFYDAKCFEYNIGPKA